MLKTISAQPALVLIAASGLIRRESETDSYIKSEANPIHRIGRVEKLA